jgi:hypothetical protein
LAIQDPALGGEIIGHLYLFLSDGSLDPGAGQRLVNYQLNLSNVGAGGTNDYFDAYQLVCTDACQCGYECHDYFPVNPEDSWVRTPYYERHFGENW